MESARGGLRTQNVWQLFRFWVLKWVLQWYLLKTFKKKLAETISFQEKTMRKSAPPKYGST
jgi:positive regulator of sigma E activity